MSQRKSGKSQIILYLQNENYFLVFSNPVFNLATFRFPGAGMTTLKILDINKLFQLEFTIKMHTDSTKSHLHRS